MRDPSTQFCHNPNCSARGKIGEGNIGIHSYKEHRYHCDVCHDTFAETKGTPLYRLHKGVDVFIMLITLLCHPSRKDPVQAIVAAFGLDERTVADWWDKAGRHCQQVHEHLVQQGLVDLQHVQADELWVKMVRRRVWMAMAMAVPSRLWLGGAISVHRDLPLITSVVEKVRQCALSLAILVCVDGLSSYVTAFRRVFRYPVRTGRRGRPRLRPETGLLLGQVVKKYSQRHVVSVAKRVVYGTAEAIAAVLVTTGSGKGINTSYIERLNATFRGALAPLVRRGRAIAHKEQMLRAGMYLVGCAYNFCRYHESLRLAAPEGTGHKWQERTPAMAAGLANHRWSMLELLSYQVPPPPLIPRKRRGRPPNRAQQPAMAVTK